MNIRTLDRTPQPFAHESLPGVTFQLSPLSPAENAGFRDRLQQGVNTSLLYGFERSVRGWEGLTNGGAPLEFKPDLAGVVLMQLPGDVQGALWDAIFNAANLTESEKKGSASPPNG